MSPGDENDMRQSGLTPESNTTSLFGLSQESLAQIVENMGQPDYRASQLWDALYRQRVETLDEITTLPKSFRDELQHAGYEIGLPHIEQTFHSADGTERYLIHLADGQTVETVWMPGGDGGEIGDGTDAGMEEEDKEFSASDGIKTGYKRATICVSSQVGCAVNCQFCFTAKLGLTRNLTAGEIAGQVAAVLNKHQVQVGKDRINLVFMGMGEPFLNYTNFMDAVRLLVKGIGIPESRMTVSTSGIVPAILDFAKESIRPKLAISLNAPNNKIRQEVMPITKKWNIEILLNAVRHVPLRPRERVTFEYVLLGGVNDGRAHASQLAGLMAIPGLPLKVNLIVWNPGPGADFKMPEPHVAKAFQQRLRESYIPAYIRRPRGLDIYAACGQLKRTLVQIGA
ncbi:MAG: 23S rRNA (adenine(2503)-C(2))-methyltransferase RlmN [Acidobacteriaceae bacterium]